MHNLVTVSMQELDRLKCVEAVIDGSLKLVRAAERLGQRSHTSMRHVSTQSITESRSRSTATKTASSESTVPLRSRAQGTRSSLGPCTG